MRDTQDEPEREDPPEPPIILISIERKAFYLFKGEEFLDQILLADGTFPTPVLCVHFVTIFDAKRVLGESFNLSQCWGVHPEIFQRLRDTDCLIETDA